MTNPPFEWTDKRLARLRQLRSEGRTYYDCMWDLDAPYGVIASKLQELGLNQRLNHGNTPGPLNAKGLRRRGRIFGSGYTRVPKARENPPPD